MLRRRDSCPARVPLRPTRLVRLAVLFGLAIALPAIADVPRLETITIDGDMDDWTAVLSNPQQVTFDHDGSSIPCSFSTDRDCIVQSVGRDMRRFAWTWDDTYFYLFTTRQAQFSNQQAFWHYLDITGPGGVPDGLMGTGDLVLRVVYKGSDRSTFNDLYRYVPIDPSGDAMVDGLSRGDGHDMPGSPSGGRIWGESSPHGGAANGLAFEERVPWSALGVPAGWPLNFHVGSSNSPNPSNLAGQIDDNLGGHDGGNGTLGFVAVSLEPDHRSLVDATGGALVGYAHSVRNDGTRAATLALRATSSLGLPIRFFRDADCDGVADGPVPLAFDANGDGDFGDVGDVLGSGADSDGDGLPDTGLLQPGGTYCFLVELDIPAGTDGVEDSTAVEAFEPGPFGSTDEATDLTTIGVVTLRRDRVGRAAAGNRADYALETCNDGTAGAVQFRVTSALGWDVTLSADDDCDGDADRLLGTDLGGDGTWDPPVPGDGDLDGQPDVILATGQCACLVASLAVDAGQAIGDVDLTGVTAAAPSGTAVATLTTVVAEPVDLSPDYIKLLPDAHCGVATGPDATHVLVGPGSSAFFPHRLDNALPTDGTFALGLVNHVMPWTARFWSDPDGDGSIADGQQISAIGPLEHNGGVGRLVLEIKVPSDAALGAVDQACSTGTSDTGPSASATDELEVTNMVTYSDATYTTSASFFGPCDTVYVKATGLAQGNPGHLIPYEFQYRDLAGNVVDVTDFFADALGEAQDQFVLPASPLGAWSVSLTDPSGVVGLVTVTVEANVSFAPLATSQRTYQLVGDDVTAIAVPRSDNIRAVLTDIVREYALVSPAGTQYYDDAGGTWLPYAGAESTRAFGPDDLPPGGSFDDGFTALAVAFPAPGVYRLVGRIRDTTCGAVLRLTSRTFIVAAAETECADEIDNDGDGATDCADPDCIGDPACPEAGNCTDAVDNDDDGVTDCADADCIGDPACPEAGHCSDGVDNDGDGPVDCADSDCAGDPACPETGHCSDGIDNDGDGTVDCADSDCIGDPACPETGRCSDGIDNDGDGDADCADFDCIGDPACPEAGHCSDEIDNDADGSIDCDDADCDGDPACPETGRCSDGRDNDGDGLVDCADPDCIGDRDCPEGGHCTDGIDNDGDGLVDCADADCIGDPGCPESGHCADAVDNDGDGLVDCADPDCIGDPALDCDIDGFPNGIDCAPTDPTAFAIPPVVDRLDVRKPAIGSTEAEVLWTDVSGASGSGTVYDVTTGRIDQLWSERDFRSAQCLAGDSAVPTAVDARLAGTGAFYYLVRGQNACGLGEFAPGNFGPRTIDPALCN